MATRRSLFERTEAAANAAQAKQQGGGDNGILALRSLLGGSRTPPRSNSEAWGRAFQTFILPMIIQGVQTWKERYDQRGSDKLEADRLTELLKRGEKLTTDQQIFLENMNNRYKDNPDYRGRWSAPAPQGGTQPAPQAQQAPANDVNTSTMMDYIRSTLPQFEDPAQRKDIYPTNALSGETLAQEANDNLANKLYQQDDDNNILKWLNGIRW